MLSRGGRRELVRFGFLVEAVVQQLPESCARQADLLLRQGEACLLIVLVDGKWPVTDTDRRDVYGALRELKPLLHPHRFVQDGGLLGSGFGQLADRIVDLGQAVALACQYVEERVQCRRRAEGTILRVIADLRLPVAADVYAVAAVVAFRVGVVEPRGAV